jgi:sugar/nucleoside kinase (ribokinase family)
MTNTKLRFHVVGDSYVDLFCFLERNLPKLGGDSTLLLPIQTIAGGSTINTATHLKHLLLRSSSSIESTGVVVHTMLNPNDDYGQLLLKHAREHQFDLVNCFRPPLAEGIAANESSRIIATSAPATPHCAVMVVGGDRSFMTHRGCSEHFTAYDFDIDALIRETDEHVHLHVAGFYCTPGFGGSLTAQILRLRQERAKKLPESKTVVSLVTQYDVSEGWNGGIDELIPHLSLVIMNEIEASKIVGGISNAKSSDELLPLDVLVAFFSKIGPDVVFVVTRGENGAIGFRNHTVIANVRPAACVEVVDPTGAGDAFVSGYLYGMWRWRSENPSDTCDWSKQEIEYALSWGCAVGSSAVSVRGASVPVPIETITELYNKQTKNST